jgi:integrase
MLPVDAGKITLAAYLDQWLAIKRSAIKPKTYEVYEYIARLHILPALGPRKLAELRADHLESLYARKQEAGLSARSVQIAHRVLHKALGDALRRGLLARNVADAATSPKPRRPEMKVWTPEEAASFLKATADDRQGAAYAVLLNCGLRLGELLGLRWEDVDMDGRRLQIRRALQRLKGGKGLVVIEPKSPRARPARRDWGRKGRS